MKTRKLIYITIGSVLVFLNLLIVLFTPATPNPEDGDVNDAAFNAGYYGGRFLFFFIALILFLLAYNVTRKIKAKEKSSLEKAIDEINISVSTED